mmetsp:Transcript_10737/g.19086  ORF Transcript_10737/g.19086 Transcript_10737/m.19086 type:complete len:204 (-) Transcript_10737:1567-2178(-)
MTAPTAEALAASTAHAFWQSVVKRPALRSKPWLVHQKTLLTFLSFLRLNSCSQPELRLSKSCSSSASTPSSSASSTMLGRREFEGPSASCAWPDADPGGDAIDGDPFIDGDGARTALSASSRPNSTSSSSKEKGNSGMLNVPERDSFCDPAFFRERCFSRAGFCRFARAPVNLLAFSSNSFFADLRKSSSNCFLRLFASATIS